MYNIDHIVATTVCLTVCLSGVCLSTRYVMVAKYLASMWPHQVVIRYLEVIQLSLDLYEMASLERPVEKSKSHPLM